jgi:hypothetical protein
VTRSSIAPDLALLSACWRSIGLRGASVEWELDQPVRLTGSLATRLRSALGPALAAGGARSGTLANIPGDGPPPALWFRGWDCPARPVRRVRAELRCVAAVAPDWPALRRALSRLRLPPAGGHGPLAATVRCSVSWHGGATGDEFGAPLFDADALEISGGACLVETISPLQLVAQGRMVSGPPPFDVLVRSAGERLRQLCLHWAEGAEALPTLIGLAHRESRESRLAWAEMGRPVEVVRRSSTGRTQLIRGIRGTFAYENASPLAMTLLVLGSEAGIGKGSAFGCGQLRVLAAEEP